MLASRPTSSPAGDNKKLWRLRLSGAVSKGRRSVFFFFLLKPSWWRHVTTHPKRKETQDRVEAKNSPSHHVLLLVCLCFVVSMVFVSHLALRLFFDTSSWHQASPLSD